MIKYLALIALAASMVWLGVKGLEPQPTQIDPALKPAVELWQREMDRAGLDWRPAWQSLRTIQIMPSGKFAGCANHWTGEVLISVDLLEKGPYSTLSVVYHELGHYCFGLEHSAGIMEPTETMTEQEWKSQWKPLVQEYILTCRKHTNE